MRLIDADAMIEDLLTVDPRYETMVNWCITVVEAQPTIEERRRGEWIDEGQYTDFFPQHAFCCSECGQHLLEIEMIYDYCPHCGARMVNADD